MSDDKIEFLDCVAVRLIAGNISRGTLFRWINLGLFPKAIKIGPSRIAWRSSDVDMWARERVEASKEAA